MIEVHKKTMEEFMGLYIDFWQFLYLRSDLRIKKKEREFMVHTLVLNAKGVDISGKDYVKEMVTRMNLRSDNEVYNYRSRLRNKGFLLKDGNDTILPQALNVKEVPQETFFQFKVICAEPTKLQNQKPVRQINKMGDLDRPVKKVARPKLPDYEPPANRYTQPPPANVEVPDTYATRDVPKMNYTSQEPDVILPPKPPADPAPDPLEDVSKFARSMATEKRKEFVPMEKKYDGYSSTEYQEFVKNRDLEKLPPIPGFEDEVPGDVKESKYYQPPRKKSRNIISLDD